VPTRWFALASAVALAGCLLAAANQASVEAMRLRDDLSQCSDVRTALESAVEASLESRTQIDELRNETTRLRDDLSQCTDVRTALESDLELRSNCVQPGRQSWW
jgi:septal ring factor EnvC (AmiA/AmiB activator)